MSSLSAWILSIAGVAVLSVLVDLVLPEGQTNKYIKGIFSFVMVVIIISPLPKLLKKDFNLSDYFTSEEYVLQEDYIYQVNRNKLDYLESSITINLSEKGISGVEVKIAADIFSSNMQIESVFVDLQNLVILENNANINIKEEVKRSVKKYISIEEGRILFNE